jgi:ABC-type Fe3+ transport system permease subunit
MIQKIKTAFLIALLCFSFNSLFVVVTASAAPKDQVLGGASSVNDGGTSDLAGTFKKVINTLLFITGMIAVLFIVIGGLRFVTSNGDSNQASQARNTVLYAVIGLVVAIMAYAIVNFVVSNI